MWWAVTELPSVQRASPRTTKVNDFPSGDMVQELANFGIGSPVSSSTRKRPTRIWFDTNMEGSSLASAGSNVKSPMSMTAGSRFNFTVLVPMSAWGETSDASGSPGHASVWVGATTRASSVERASAVTT